MTERGLFLPNILMVFEKPGEFGYLANEYLRAFYDNGWNVTVCYLTGNIDDNKYRELPAHSVICFELGKKQIRGLKIASIKKMVSFLRKNKYNLIISHQYQANSCVAVSTLFSKKQIKYAVFHGIDPTSSTSRNLFYSTFGRAFTRFISVSNTQKENILKNTIALKQEKVHVLNNAVNIEYINERLKDRSFARQALKIQSNDFIIGTISRLTQDKRIVDLVHALKILESKIPEAKVLIIGEGKERENIIKESLKNEVFDKIILSGYINEAWRFIKAFDVFVLPSKFESCGLVLLEALVARIPVIASNTAGAKGTVDNCGFFFDIGNYNQFAEKIIQCYFLNNAEKKSIAESGFQRIMNNFDKSIFQKRILHMAYADIN
jgi:glycosyltransferase involved in cell wall biosynthesis